MSTDRELALLEAAYQCAIPDYMVEGVVNYVVHHIAPGDFLCAVIANDLFEAYGRADSTNIHCIYNYVRFFYNYAPAPCWGSREALQAWVKMAEEKSDER